MWEGSRIDLKGPLAFQVSRGTMGEISQTLTSHLSQRKHPESDEKKASLSQLHLSPR